ncbi:hypothetical protein HZB97_01715 [Candidatus Gottesmanbacteria bacterium]|nr:hypothetical protein [Candidatus Gottesmanbacteria bacterium]
MEQHPVHQNITSFQFKLIGDMTIKQFLFLAFRKSIYAPTQFLWKKKAVAPEILTAPVITTTAPVSETLQKQATQAKIEEYLMSLPQAPLSASDLDQKEENFVNQALGFFSGQPVPTPEPSAEPSLVVTPAIPTPPSPQPLPEPLLVVNPPTPPPDLELQTKTEELTDQITSLQKELHDKEITKDRFIEIQGQLASLFKEKERLIKELVELKKMLSKKPEPVVKPYALAEVPEEPTVKIVPSSIFSQIGLPKPPTLPNAPSGLVKTQKGAILPNILVEIRDQEGTPVRALKTNKLGQFAVVTPLANGTYTLHLQDPKDNYYFDIIQITLDGNLVAPLEIFAKTEVDRQRAELTKKIFGKDNFFLAIEHHPNTKNLRRSPTSGMIWCFLPMVLAV